MDNSSEVNKMRTQIQYLTDLINNATTSHGHHNKECKSTNDKGNMEPNLISVKKSKEPNISMESDFHSHLGESYTSHKYTQQYSYPRNRVDHFHRKNSRSGTLDPDAAHFRFNKPKNYSWKRLHADSNEIKINSSVTNLLLQETLTSDKDISLCRNVNLVKYPLSVTESSIGGSPPLQSSIHSVNRHPTGKSSLQLKSSCVSLAAAMDVTKYNAVVQSSKVKTSEISSKAQILQKLQHTQNAIAELKEVLNKRSKNHAPVKPSICSKEPHSELAQKQTVEISCSVDHSNVSNDGPFVCRESQSNDGPSQVSTAVDSRRNIMQQLDMRQTDFMEAAHTSTLAIPETSNIVKKTKHSLIRAGTKPSAGSYSTQTDMSSASNRIKKADLEIRPALKFGHLSKYSIKRLTDNSNKVPIVSQVHQAAHGMKMKYKMQNALLGTSSSTSYPARVGGWKYRGYILKGPTNSRYTRPAYTYDYVFYGGHRQQSRQRREMHHWKFGQHYATQWKTAQLKKKIPFNPKLKLDKRTSLARQQVSKSTLIYNRYILRKINILQKKLSGIPQFKLDQMQSSVRDIVNECGTQIDKTKKVVFNPKFRLDRRSGIASPKATNFIMINGMLYKSNRKQLVRADQIVQSGNRKSLKTQIKSLDTKNMKTVTVRGVKFKVDGQGKTLKRLASEESSEQTSTSAELSQVSRVDIGGVTYIQTCPGTLEKLGCIKSRVAANQVISKTMVRAAVAKYKKDNTKLKKNYCMFYNRFGKCNRQEKCPYVHDPDKVAVCTRFLRGTCKIKNCPFSHKIAREKMPVCSYFLKGVCNKDDCPYLHVNVNRDAKICDKFLKGYCPDGEKCTKKHILECAEFLRTGTCLDGKKCRLQHRKSLQMGTITDGYKGILRHRKAERRKSKMWLAAKKNSQTTATTDHLETSNISDEADRIDTLFGMKKKLPAYISLSVKSSLKPNNQEEENSNKKETNLKLQAAAKSLMKIRPQL